MAARKRADDDIQQDIISELDWDPEVEAIEFMVAVDDGVVSLTGQVDSYARKLAMERAAQRVDGVRAVVNDLAVISIDVPADTVLAKTAADRLEASTRVPCDRLEITVQNGVVTLGGELDWDYQRTAAMEVIQDIAGIRDIIDRIAIIQPEVSESDVKAGIEQAFVRSAQIEADRIDVSVQDSHVILAGIVRTWRERREARDAAMRAKGVTQVSNLIEVEQS